MVHRWQFWFSREILLVSFYTNIIILGITCLYPILKKEFPLLVYVEPRDELV